jgi:glycosyltransferase involved in cell wall biosynthesis
MMEPRLHAGNGGTTVALFFPSFAGGGAERVMLLLADAMLSKGVRVDIVVARAEGPRMADVPVGARVVELGARRMLAAFLPLVKYLRTEKPHTVLSTLVHANVIAIAANLFVRPRCKIVVREANTVSREAAGGGRLRERVLPWFARLTYPLADGVVAVSQGVADDLERLGAVSRDRLYVINNPVPLSDIEAKAMELLDDENFDGSMPVILGIGRLVPQKDFPTLLRAFRQVRLERNCRLMILGDGPERHALESLARELEIDQDVVLPGFVENPYAYLHHGSLFVLSSVWEGFPNVLVEAMATGIPVVATDCPSGPAEILENGNLGPLVPVGDVDGMAAAIIRTLDKPPSPEALQHRVRKYDPEVVVERYVRVLNNSLLSCP